MPANHTGPESLPAGEQAMALLLRPVRHAVNNLSMVMNANLETAVPQLPEGERVTKQVARARDAAVAYDNLVRGFLSLGREEGVKGVLAGRLLRELMPLLALAAGGPLELEVADAAKAVQRRTPTLEGALILAASGARDLPAGPLPPLRLEGLRLVLGWPLPPAARRSLEDLGVGIEAAGEGVAILLPPG
ncbi:hypothetical protein [Muricoccus nepalensis]|nr:hypothetical protein [Roseomonas nepalensis]